ncbi:MAG TPA: hypothetical protein VKB34_12390 [Povalibacter sp.]|nr:hypothetical protein [Povalibacter sp.]
MSKAETEMSNWLAHPNEFGEGPAEIREIHRELTDWPLEDQKVELVLHRYRMADGFTSIGMTGPITWSFLGDGVLDGLSMDEIKRAYAGWYVSFLAVQQNSAQSQQIEARRQDVLRQLQSGNPAIQDVTEFLPIGQLLFYVYKEKRGDREMVVATDQQFPREYPADSQFLKLPVLYNYIGSLFFEGRL